MGERFETRAETRSAHVPAYKGECRQSNPPRWSTFPACAARQEEGQGPKPTLNLPRLLGGACTNAASERQAVGTGVHGTESLGSQFVESCSSKHLHFVTAQP